MARASLWVMLGFFVFMFVTRVECFTSGFGHEFNPNRKLKIKPKDKDWTVVSTTTRARLSREPRPDLL